MCLQSPDYDILEHMIYLNEWYLNLYLPNLLEDVENKICHDGFYLIMCNKLKHEHETTSEFVENYVLLSNTMNVEAKNDFTKTVKEMEPNSEMHTEVDDYTTVVMDLERDEKLYNLYIKNTMCQFPIQ
jgi:hypothetical protein